MAFCRAFTGNYLTRISHLILEEALNRLFYPFIMALLTPHAGAADAYRVQFTASVISRTLLQKITADFKGGSITSDAGSLSLTEIEWARDFIKEFS